MASKISSLIDVKLTSPQTEQVLTYDSVLGVWINKISAADVLISSPLRGKKIGIIGSSSSASGTDDQGNYPKWVQDRTGCIVDNQSVYGSATTSQLGHIDLLAPDLDLMFIMSGGSEDNTPVGVPPNIGQFSDRGDTTAYGIFHQVALKIYQKYDPAKTAITWSILPHSVAWTQNRTIDPGYYINPVHEAIKEVAHYYGMPVLDLVHEGNAPFHHPFIKQKYMQTDDLHLTHPGNQIISYRVERFWIQSLQGRG